MKLIQVSPNCNELVIGSTSILFSYETPVAYRGPEGCFRTEVKHSLTTSKYISQWGAAGFETRPQSWFDRLLEG